MRERSRALIHSHTRRRWLVLITSSTASRARGSFICRHKNCQLVILANLSPNVFASQFLVGQRRVIMCAARKILVTVPAFFGVVCNVINALWTFRSETDIWLQRYVDSRHLKHALDAFTARWGNSSATICTFEHPWRFFDNSKIFCV